MKLFNKLAFKIALIFLVLYGMCAIYGTHYLVSWGHTNTTKSALLLFYKFPFDWASLISEVSILFLPLNILFWSGVVYLVALGIVKLKLTLSKSHKSSKT